MTASLKTLIGITALAICAAAAAAQSQKPAAAAPAAAPAAPAAGPGNSQAITVTPTDPASPVTLRVNFVMGDIIVRGSNRKDVVIEPATKDGDSLLMSNRSDPAEARGLRKLTQSAGFSVEQRDNDIEVRSTGMRQSVAVVIQVPTRANLNLATVNDGDVRVENVDGELEIGNVNGSIELTDVGGTIVAHMVNGDVAAKVTRVTPDKSSAFTSLNGEIDVTLPAATKASLKLRSDNGDVFSDFDLQLEQRAARTSGEDLRRNGRYRVDRMISGTINGGGAQIEGRTFNGNVYIRKGK